jgi:hypothetical protein
MRQIQVNNKALIRLIAFIVTITISIVLYKRTVYEDEMGSIEHERCIEALKIKKNDR